MNKEKLPKGWDWKKLGDICDKPEYGYTTSAKQDGSGPLFVRTTDISEGEIVWTSVPFCTELPKDEEKYRLKDGDILIARAGSIGASVVVTKPPRAVFASYLIRFRPKKDLDPSYAKFYLKSMMYWVQLGSKSAGTTLPGVNATNLSKVKIPLPPLSTQRKIVSILEKAERTKRSCARAEGLIDELLKSVFVEMFGNPVKNEKRWKIEKFENVCETRLGKMLDAKKQTGKNNRPYLRNTNIQWGRINLDEVFEMDFDELERETLRLKERDLLICEGGEIGRTAIWHCEIPECYFQKAVHRARPYADKAISEFLLYLMQFYAKNGGFQLYSSQSTIAHLTGEKLKSLKIPLPPLPLQQQFARIVEKVEAMRERHKKAKQEVDDLFDALMQKAFTGELIT